MYTLARLTLCIMSFHLLGIAQVSSYKLTPAAKESVRINYISSGDPSVRWENGYFLAVRLQPEYAIPVTAFDSSGTKLFETSLSIDGVARIHPDGLAISSTGSFTVSGTAFSADGSFVSFIAWLDRTGKLVRVVRLEKFSAVAMSFVGEHLWVVGKAITYPSREEAPDHDMIRIYDRQGKFEKSLLPRSTFPARTFHPGRLAFLASNGKTVVFLSAELGYLAQISQDGTILGIQTGPLPASPLVSGLAISENSEILMSCQSESLDKTQQVSIYRWIQGSGSWEAVYSTALKHPGGYRSLMGFDGDAALVANHSNPLSYNWLILERKP